MRGRYIPYSEAELLWIQRHCDWPRAKAHEAFVARFDRGDVSLQNFKALCKRKGWLTGRTGRFVKGQESRNKGKPMPYHPNSAATRFKKGNRTGRANENWKPIGTERITEDGYIERKIHDGMPLQSRWRAVHLIRWEEAHGPVPAGHCLKCLDGNKANTDPDNWEAVPRALLPRLAGGRRLHKPYDEYEPEARPAVLAIARLEHAAREARKGNAQRKGGQRADT
ncbi:MAG: HNH endonuclease [Rhodobacteraceae bacterium HLUCCA12]|nr:MAG: HNH endonuclease [Rhodobacteraceae bacterium HLUCCA12]